MLSEQVSSGGIEATDPKEPSFDDLLTAEESPASDPHTDSPEADAAPAEQGQDTDAVERQDSGEQQQDREPFIPRDRFDEVNTKLKEAREFRDRYGWAEGLDPQAVQTMREWFGRASADPRAFALQLVDELAQTPEHAQYLRSEMARRLGTRAKAGEASTDEAEPQPDIDVTDGQGNIVGKTFSDKQLAKRDEYRERQLMSRFEQQYGDRFKTLDQLQQQHEAQAAQAKADQFASSFAAELSKLPLFDQHKADVGQYIKAHPPTSDEPGEVKANALMAYWAVVGPKLNGSGKSEVLADLQRKAKANTGVNPGASSSASPPNITDFDDPRLEWG